MKIDVWHNILWSRYKGAVFSQLSSLCESTGNTARFFQIAKTEGAQALLSQIDYSAHKYNYELIFDSNYGAAPLWKMLYETGRRVWSSDADVIILAGYSRPEYFLQLLLGKLRGKKICVSCDSTALDRKKTAAKDLMKKFFFGACDGVFAYGLRSADYVASHGVSRDKIFFPIQTAPPIVEMPASDILARRETIFARPPHFLFVGRLAPVKGLDVLIDAFARFHERRPDARLTIVGAGELKDKLEQQAAALGLRDVVTLAGAKTGSALADAILDATALVLPSRAEPWGLVVNEALSLGVPAIVSDRCGCVPELIAEGRTGYVVRTGDADDLSEKMLQLSQEMVDGQEVARTCMVVSRLVV